MGFVLRADQKRKWGGRLLIPMTKIQKAIALVIVIAVYLGAAVLMWQEKREAKFNLCPLCGQEVGK